MISPDSTSSSYGHPMDIRNGYDGHKRDIRFKYIGPHRTSDGCPFVTTLYVHKISIVKPCGYPMDVHRTDFIHRMWISLVDIHNMSIKDLLDIMDMPKGLPVTGILHPMNIHNMFIENFTGHNMDVQWISRCHKILHPVDVQNMSTAQKRIYWQ